jgi:hypothetical protein
MSTGEIQQLCGRGQEFLTEQHYLEAEEVLVQAEREAYRLHDWDTLSRLYMPLQEARRQRRQKCTEGIVSLSLISQNPNDHILGRHVVENYPHGQLLVAGWGTIEPAMQTRKLQARFKLYVEVFLGAVYPLLGGGHAIVIAPHEQVVLPEMRPRHLEEFRQVLQPGCIVVREEDLPPVPQRGDMLLQARLQGWWESLSRPFLLAARETLDLRKRIDAYRKAIRVDYACELAHQELAATAHELSRLTVRS